MLVTEQNMDLKCLTSLFPPIILPAQKVSATTKKNPAAGPGFQKAFHLYFMEHTFKKWSPWKVSKQEYKMSTKVATCVDFLRKD